MMSLTLAAATLALLSASAPALTAAAPLAEDEAKLLADDLRFAEALAVARFYDLADEVVAQTVASIDRMPGDEIDLAGEASLIRARVALRRSEATADEDERLASLNTAIAELEDWSKPGSSFAFLDRMTDALEELARALRERGKEYVARSKAGDGDAAAMANADFSAADEMYQAVAREAEDRAQQAEDEERADQAAALRARAYTTYYNRGLNSVEWAEVAADPQFRLEEAIDQLDEFGWEVSDESLVYYSALYEQGRAYYKLGELDDARGIMESVLENGIPFFWEYVDQYPAAQQPLVAGLFDAVWGFLARMEAEAGDLAASEAWIETMLSQHETKGVAIGREGHQALLDYAETLNDLGRSGEATDLANRVAKEGDGTPQGGRAKRLLGEWIGGGSGGGAGSLPDSPDTLLSAATGRFEEKDYGDAAFLFQMAAVKSVDDDQRQRIVYNAWMGAGRALRASGRLLEAAVAFEAALDAAQMLHADDIARIESAANLMYQSYASRFTNTQSAFDRGLRDQASERILSIPGIELDVQYAKAEEAFAELAKDDTQGYLRVLAEFEAVPESSPNYERALVASARCLQGAGRLEDALERYGQMEARAEDPNLTPTNEAARSKREAALAQARYFHAQLLLSDDVNRPAEALTVLDGFEGDVPSQVDFHAGAKWQRTVAFALAGQVAEAEASLEELQDFLGDNQPTLVSSAAYRVGQALRAAYRASVDAGRPDDAVGLRAAEAMALYLETSSYGSYTNILATAEWFLEVAEYERGRVLFDKAMEAHGDAVSEDRLDDARMGLARAYDLQRDFGRARPLWLDLLARNPRSPQIRLGAARSLGGWLELDDSGQVVEVPGSGDYDKAHEIWVDLWKSAGASAKYTSLWWQA